MCSNITFSTVFINKFLFILIELLLYFLLRINIHINLNFMVILYLSYISCSVNILGAISNTSFNFCILASLQYI